MRHRTTRAPTDDRSGLVSWEESWGLDASETGLIRLDATRSRYVIPGPI